MIINYLPAVEHPLFKNTAHYFVSNSIAREKQILSGTSLLATIKPGEKIAPALIDFFLKQSITRY